MQIKSKLIFLIVSFVIFFAFNNTVKADEFNITATEVLVDKKNNTIIGKGSVKVIDKQGRVINADKVTYKKTKEFLLAEGAVKIFDTEGNILTSDRATYDKINEIIISFNNSTIVINDSYKVKSNKILYNINKEMISSPQESILSDIDGNIATVSMFQYLLKKNLFSTIGKINVVDANKNKYFFKELHIDTKKKEMIGSDASVVLDQENFGVNQESDPRFVSNDIFITKEETKFSKGVFTICKQRDDKCPPWSLQAKKITHNKIKKTIYYENAILKVYDVPIFYFPRFLHPDPSVKRTSGFLNPIITKNSSLGSGFGLPYFWAVSNDKDITFTPKFYSKESAVFMNEYRQAFKNGFLTLDTSYTEGYKNITSTKTSGSRNHIFAELDFNFNENNSYESKLSIKTQRTSNDTYLKVHDINTSLVAAEETNLSNKVSYNFAKDNMYLDISGYAYENINRKNNNRYEYILPNIVFGKSFFTEKLGQIDFKSNALYRNYDADKHLTSLTNDIVWSPGSTITKKGFINTVQGMIKNTNYDAKNTNKYKTKSTVNEIASVLSFKSSLPMIKKGINFSNIFSPTYMIRYAPGHMRDLGTDNVSLNYTNLYSINKTSEIDSGLSGILGFEYKVNQKDKLNNEKEKLSISLGQVINAEKNNDMPSKSSLDKKMSDLVGQMNYNFSEIGNINYKFSVDNNFDAINYNQVSTGLTLGKVSFNLDYLEEQNHIGNQNYVNSGISLNFNDSSKLSFETKKNFVTESTELYNISYQYINDCLTAGLTFRREFYEDSDTDVQPNDSLMFVIKFIPFTGVKAPLK